MPCSNVMEGLDTYLSRLHCDSQKKNYCRNVRNIFLTLPLVLPFLPSRLISIHSQIISAQQIPRQRDSQGREIVGKATPDPYVEITVHVPDWPQSPSLPSADTLPTSSSTPARTMSFKTSVVKNNGFNPVWFEGARLPFECVGEMMDLIFVKFAVRQESWEESEPLAVHCSSLGNLQCGETPSFCTKMVVDLKLN
jgi:hypothetical protein